MTEIKLGDTVITRKPHACGCNLWKVVRVGADYKIQCEKCLHTVMLDSVKFHKAVKKVVGQDGTTEN